MLLIRNLEILTIESGSSIEILSKEWDFPSMFLVYPWKRNASRIP